MDDNTGSFTNNLVDIVHAISVLNEALTLDRLAITQLFNTMVPCKKQLAESNSVEAMLVKDSYATTALGILNAIFSYSDTEQYRIFPVYDEQNMIAEFRLGRITSQGG